MASYRRSPSTPSRSTAGKIKAARPGQRVSPGVARSIVFRPGDLRHPVTVSLKWCSGAEPWVAITRDRHTVRMPAQLAVWELVLMLHGWEAGTHR